MRKLLFIVPPASDEDFTAWLYACAEAGGVKLDYFGRHFLDQDINGKNPVYIRNVKEFLNTNSDYSHLPSAEDFLFRHSDIAINSLFTRAWYTGVKVNTVLNGTAPEPFVRLLNRKPFRYCPACAEEDIKKYGREIAHVPHQAADTAACWKHGYLLTEDPQDRKAEYAKPFVVRKAQLIHELYVRRAMGCLEDIADEIGKRLAGREKEGKMIRTDQTYCPDAAGTLAELCTNEEIISLYIKGVIKRKKNDADEAEAAGMEIVSSFGPFLTLRCRTCGGTHYAFSGSCREDLVCGKCGEKSWKERMALRMQPRLREDLEVKGFPDGKHADLIHRPCGTVLEGRFIRTLMNSGNAECQFCAEAGRMNHVGEKRTMNCGLEAEITRFGSVVDIDIEFEDGRTRKGVVYRNFLDGSIIPNRFYQDLHIGKKRIMNCGLEAEITASYKKDGRDLIDVRFEDGSEKTGVTYAAFKTGRLEPDGYRKSKAAEAIVGQWRMMNCGIRAKVILCRGYDDCDVEFEDGSVKRGVRRDHFLNGELSPEGFYLPKAGEERVMRNGLTAKIIAVRSSADINVQFENGEVRTGIQYNAFRDGYVKSLVLEEQRKNSHIGEVYRQNCGVDAEVTAYMNAFNCTVRFSNGEVRERVIYSKLKEGSVLPPSLQNVDRVGEKHMQGCGQEAEITAYRDANDVDVKFPDGKTREHVTYYDIVHGRINPLKRGAKFREEHLGEERTMKCGLKAKIIEVRGAMDIDVQFETGEVREHIVYANFKSGAVSPTKRES